MPASIRTSILRWYRRTARAFPWRGDHVDPYMVLVSEFMLQQTQASRVAEKMPVFLDRFPSIRTLAAADNADIIRAWQGMGYNSRALRLRDAARAIVERHDGVVPHDVDTLRTLPGIGPYASSAIACFAYGVRTIVLDVNIRRVYSRTAERQTTTIDVLPDARLRDIAEALIPHDDPAEWHHAVMDLGATICTARSPQCMACPLTSICPSSNTMREAVRAKKKEPSFRGLPNRIWRGRVVEALRSPVHADGMGMRTLFTRITATPPSDDDMQWFGTIVDALRKDGMIVVEGDNLRL